MKYFQSKLAAMHHYAANSHELFDLGIPYPKAVWERYYGTALHSDGSKEIDRRTGQPVSQYLYNGYSDGSRLRIKRGGDISYAAPNSSEWIVQPEEPVPTSVFTAITS